MKNFVYFLALSLSLASVSRAQSSGSAAMEPDPFQTSDDEIRLELGDNIVLQGQNNQGQNCTVKVQATSYGHLIEIDESHVSSIEPQARKHFFKSFSHKGLVERELVEKDLALREGITAQKPYFENQVRYRDFHSSYKYSKKDSKGIKEDISSELIIGGQTPDVGPLNPQFPFKGIRFIAVATIMSSKSLYADEIFKAKVVSCAKKIGSGD